MDVPEGHKIGADVRRASLACAFLKNAWMEGAIWPDGRICAKGSISEGK
jgi:hypothetical protein